MASGNAESSNLMDEFEDAFQACLLSLTKQEPNTGTNKEEIDLEVQKTTNRFIDVARQMEAFFLQKRFLVSTLKPYMLIKDENQDLETEIKRKENLLNKHYNRLEEWKACLADMQQTQGGHNRPVGAPGMSVPTGGLGPSRGPAMMPNLPQQMQQGIGPGNQMQPGQQHMMQAQKMQQFRMTSKMPK